MVHLDRHFIAIGTATLDRVYQMQDLPHEGGKYRAHAYLEVGGGIAANAAVAIARLGERVEFIGRVGSDAAGRHIVAGLAAERVGTRGVQIIRGTRSVTPAVLVDASGERITVSNTDPRLYDGAGGIDAMLEEVERSAGVMADVRWIAGAKIVLQAARRAGRPVVLDVEKAPRAAVDELAPLASHLLFSRPGLEFYSGQADPGRGLLAVREVLDGVVGVTLGGDGALIATGTGVVHIPAPAVKVVDTTGAGDAFHGAYVVAVADGADAIEAARFASAVAALKCTRLGGRAGLPTRDEVEDFRRLHG